MQPMKNIVLIIILSLSFHVEAEIFRQASVCTKTGKMCFYWWPKLKEISGWSQDVPHSFHYRANAQAPDGFTFDNAEAVIYAKAVYKPQEPEIKSLGQFIEQDKLDFLAKNPNLTVTQIKELSDSSGREYVSFIFRPEGNGNWEQVAYSEEKDQDGNEYYLVFVLSSRTETGYNNSISAFKQFIVSYE